MLYIQSIKSYFLICYYKSNIPDIGLTYFSFSNSANSQALCACSLLHLFIIKFNSSSLNGVILRKFPYGK